MNDPTLKVGPTTILLFFGYNIEKGTKIRSKISGALPQGLTFFGPHFSVFLYTQGPTFRVLHLHTHTHPSLLIDSNVSGVWKLE